MLRYINSSENKNLLKGRIYHKKYRGGSTAPFIRSMSAAMMKRVLSLLLVSCLFAGCENAGGGKTSTHTASSAENTAAGSDVPETDHAENQNTDTEPTATPELVIQKSSVKADTEVYSDNIRIITTLGLKEYAKLKGNNHTDKPSGDRKYLVLFLEVQNLAEKDLYFNVDYLSAKLDGKKLENTFLLNDPEKYTTIFKNIKAGDYQQGFIAWEVPKNWKKLVVTFKEFELFGGKRLKLTATPKNLKDPKPPIVRAAE